MLQRLGIWELIIIALLLLLIFGGRRLPALGSALARAVKNFRSGVKESDKSADGSGGTFEVAPEKPESPPTDISAAEHAEPTEPSEPGAAENHETAASEPEQKKRAAPKRPELTA